MNKIARFMRDEIQDLHKLAINRGKRRPTEDEQHERVFESEREETWIVSKTRKGIRRDG